MASRGVNKVILVGNLGNDPETRYMPSGGAVTNITIATSESWKDKQTGQPQERTEWHRVVFFNRLGEIAGEYLRKGSKIYVEGSLRTRKWQDKSGQDRYTTEIVASEMQMLDSRGGASGADYAPPQQKAASQAAPAAGSGAGDGGGGGGGGGGGYGGGATYGATTGGAAMGMGGMLRRGRCRHDEDGASHKSRQQTRHGKGSKTDVHDCHLHLNERNDVMLYYNIPSQRKFLGVGLSARSGGHALPIRRVRS